MAGPVACAARDVVQIVNPNRKVCFGLGPKGLAVLEAPERMLIDDIHFTMMLGRVMTALIVAATVLALPAAASATGVHCGNLPSHNIFDIAGHRVGCPTARAVAKAETRALLTPGSGAKHFIKVDGRRWHYTWRDVNTSPTTQIESYRATSGRQTVTFETHGSN